MKSIIILTVIGVALAGPAPQQAQVLRFENENGGEYYKFGYELSDGSQRDEQGKLRNAHTDTASFLVQGSYSWVGPDGVTYTVTYLADENGFRPKLRQTRGGSIPAAVISSFVNN